MTGEDWHLLRDFRNALCPGEMSSITWQDDRTGWGTFRDIIRFAPSIEEIS
jgi:hypothetical protein